MDVFDALPVELKEEIRRSCASQISARDQLGDAAQSVHGAEKHIEPRKKRVRLGGTRKLEAFFSPLSPRN
jgi:hypothetical protein